MIKAPLHNFYNLSNIEKGAEGLLFSAIVRQYDGGFVHVYIAEDDKNAKILQDSVRFFVPQANIIYFPAYDTEAYDRNSPKRNIIHQRLEALAKINQFVKAGDGNNSNNSDDRMGRMVIITTVRALCSAVVPKEILAENTLFIKKSGEITQEKLLNFLVANSYQATHTVREEGEFSHRGSIIDIKPSCLDAFFYGTFYETSKNVAGNIDADVNFAFRIDFFGNQIEKIKQFNIETQTSVGEVENITLLPASEIILNEQAIKNFKANYASLAEQHNIDISQDNLYEAIISARQYNGAESYLPLFYNDAANDGGGNNKHAYSLFSYLLSRNIGNIGNTKGEEGLVITYGNVAIEALKSYKQQVQETYEARLEGLKMGDVYLPVKIDDLHNFDVALPRDVAQNNLSQNKGQEAVFGKDISPSPLLYLEAKKEQKQIFTYLKEYLQKATADGFSVIVMCNSLGSVGKLQNMFKNDEIPCEIIENLANLKKFTKKSKGIYGMIILPMEYGFINNSKPEYGKKPLNTLSNGNVDISINICPRTIFITEQDIFGKKILTASAKKQASSSDKIIEEISNLDEGEYIVHVRHGIGKFIKLKPIEIQNITHEFLELEYKAGDKLFLPVENIDLVSRYGGKDENPELDKLGSSSFLTRAKRVKQKVKMMADELIKVASARKLASNAVFMPDFAKYSEFSAGFPYIETQDQQKAIEETLSDLASPQPMDRLICGDVGFGKTEIAMRAAFAVSTEGGQVALICPTTILCQQHYKNFAERFKNFPEIKIAQISRLKTPTEAKKIKQAVKDGDINIIIGTHSLLAKDMKFANLSLIIIDEEQRFGVKQKEKLKSFKADINILTLTATPIPRTLQLGMSGVRELSIIATAPMERLATRTFVISYDKHTIREAIMREYFRGGRVYFVCPRISDLEEIEPKLKALVPEVRVVKAHGQMNPQELDQIMQDFYEGKYDMLLATTIIESGLDVAEANTIIIHNADKYGLAALYQLRGRVGRSKLRAYAYLTTKLGKKLTKDATKRLEVMKKLDTLGAGFTLASYDMDIRGFGNLLGEEQTGNIKEVGLSLYQSMLSEAVEKAKLQIAPKSKERHLKNGGQQEDGRFDELTQQEFTPKVNIGESVFIPTDYIKDVALRISIYRRISNLKTEEEIHNMEAELTDRFGKPTKEVSNLLKTIELKQICHRLNIEKLDIVRNSQQEGKNILNKGVSGAGKQNSFGVANITFFKNHFQEPERLLQIIAQSQKKMQITPSHRLKIKLDFNNNYFEDLKRTLAILE